MGNVLNVCRIINFWQKKLLVINKHKDYLENDENYQMYNFERLSLILETLLSFQLTIV